MARDRSTTAIAPLLAFTGILLALLHTSPALAATPGRNVFYSYDSEGYQLGAAFDSVSGSEKIANAYDGFGELKSSTNGGAALTLSYLYDADGNRTQLTFPDSQAFTYANDQLDRETGILQGTATSLATIAYDRLGQRGSLQRTGAGNTTYAYDNVSRLQGLTDQLGSAEGGSNDQALTFGYYASDQIRSRSTSNGNYA